MRRSAAGMWSGTVPAAPALRRGLHRQAPSGASEPAESQSVLPQLQTTVVRIQAETILPDCLVGFKPNVGAMTQELAGMPC
jgi:hypothetical protein